MTPAMAAWRAMLAAAGCLFVAAALAQSGSGQPNALQGFSQNRGQPINIESVSLELRDKEKMATFIDNVRLVQGDTVLECKTLVVHYDEETSTKKGTRTKPPAMTAPGSQQQIRRLEAKGGVVVTQKDQTATGDSGIFDMKTNTVTLIGNVVVTQGGNVVRGDRLWVDLNTNVSRVESGKAGQSRVQGLFLPSSRDSLKPNMAPGAEAPSPTGGVRPADGAPKPDGANAPANPTRAQSATPEKESKQAPSRPLKLN